MRKIKTLVLILMLTECVFGTIRYVSKTGSSTPPYTSWETASDSIKKCINICAPGDTVIVANGIYKEVLLINKALTFLGSSMDSCVIDGTGLDSLSLFTIEIKANCTVNGFKIIAPKFIGSRKSIMIRSPVTAEVSNCKLLVGVLESSFNTNLTARNLIIKDNSVFGIFTYGEYLTVENCVILSSNDNVSKAGILTESKNALITNNILIGEKPGNNYSQGDGIQLELVKKAYIQNNIVANYNDNINGYWVEPEDSGEISNNLSCYIRYDESTLTGITTYSSYKTYNNVLYKVNTGIYGNGEDIPGGYNLFWGNQRDFAGGYVIKETDVFADPMFVKDTMPTSSMGFDFHLQKYSPAIDAGDPTVLDVDGTRSDIGLFGGPLGQKYTYLDLAPKPPRNLTAQLSDGQILLTWNRNSEADLFRYRVYRDTVPGFIYDTSKIIGVVSDTFFVDNLPDYYRAGTYYYKITAIDSAFNQSPASEEITVVATGAAEGPPIVTEEYKLLQNYPNPFNPSTVIPYRLKEGGYVKIMVYNLLGELVKVLQNGYQNPGYYEVEFSPTKEERRKGEGILEFETFYRNDVVSGIYLYRIEVIGEGNIPRFMDMKKMMLVK
ncbi:MAG: hypothetical protein AB9882_12705 [Ignavibacteriaceae bacterium]